MKTVVKAFLIGTLLLVCACGPDRLRALPQRLSGALGAGGAVVASSPHFRLIGALGPAGGSHMAGKLHAHDGAFTNGQHAP